VFVISVDRQNADSVTWRLPDDGKCMALAEDTGGILSLLVFKPSAHGATAEFLRDILRSVNPNTGYFSNG